MAIFDTFSKRKARAAAGGKVEPYQFDKLPPALRKQIIHIWFDSIGQPQSRATHFEGGDNNPVWEKVYRTMTRELGVFTLGGSDTGAAAQCCTFLQSADVDHALDLIEISFHHVNTTVRHMYQHDRESLYIRVEPDEAIEELNARFREHSVGYQFMGGKLVRVDSQYLHQEVVKPALSLLFHARFDGPAQEFMKAHQHYRAGDTKEAIVEAQKAFESTMKAICTVRKWQFDEHATAKPLIDLLIKQGLIPAYLTSQLQGLRTLLESGLPTVRNKTSGHGQGKERVSVPDHYAAFALHVAAANIVLLVEAHRAS